MDSSAAKDESGDRVPDVSMMALTWQKRELGVHDFPGSRTAAGLGRRASQPRLAPLGPCRREFPANVTPTPPLPGHSSPCLAPHLELLQLEHGLARGEAPERQRWHQHLVLQQGGQGEGGGANLPAVASIPGPQASCPCRPFLTRPRSRVYVQSALLRPSPRARRASPNHTLASSRWMWTLYPRWAGGWPGAAGAAASNARVRASCSTCRRYEVVRAPLLRGRGREVGEDELEAGLWTRMQLPSSLRPERWRGSSGGTHLRPLSAASPASRSAPASRQAARTGQVSNVRFTLGRREGHRESS